jgi:biopolymer transport protein ExbB
MTENRFSLFELLAQGGWAMWPLGTISFGLILLLILGWQGTRRRLHAPPQLAHEAGRLLAGGNTAACGALLRGSGASLGRIGATLLDRNNLAGGDAAAWSEELARLLDEEEAQAGQLLQYLNVIAQVAPMVGLLGTVSGMIGAFQTIAGGGMGKPELLAGDIGEALITTATGLVIGIPALVGYFALRARLRARLREVGAGIRVILQAPPPSP